MACKTSRVTFLDLLRILACFFVIVNHTTAEIFQSRTPEGLTWLAAVTYFFSSKFAVPVFFMISGYLLMSRQEPWSQTFRRMGRVVLVILLTGILYWLYHGLHQEQGADWQAILANIATIHFQTPSNALWYLYNYLGLLLMMPFFGKMASAMTRQDYHIYFLVYGIVFGTIPILSHYFDFVKLNPHFGVPLFSGHITMLFIGQYFRRFQVKSTLRGVFIAGILFLAMLAFNVTLTLQEARAGSENYLFLDNRSYLPIVVQGACVFYMATGFRCGEKAGRLVSRIGSCTFGIYLLSDLAIDYLKPVFLMLSGVMHPLFAVVLFEVAIFCACLLVTVLLRSIPGLKKLL